MNSRCNLSIATAIHLRWWQLRALRKAHDPFRQFEWSAVDRAANNHFEMDTPLAPLNLHLDSMALARLQ